MGSIYLAPFWSSTPSIFTRLFSDVRFPCYRYRNHCPRGGDLYIPGVRVHVALTALVAQVTTPIRQKTTTSALHPLFKQVPPADILCLLPSIHPSPRTPGIGFGVGSYFTYTIKAEGSKSARKSRTISPKKTIALCRQAGHRQKAEGVHIGVYGCQNKDLRLWPCSEGILTGLCELATGKEERASREKKGSLSPKSRESGGSVVVEVVVGFCLVFEQQSSNWRWGGCGFFSVRVGLTPKRI